MQACYCAKKSIYNKLRTNIKKTAGKQTMEIKNIKTSGTIMFHINNLKKEKQISALCRSLGLVTRTIKQQDINKPLGSICTQGAIKGSSMFLNGERKKAPDKYKLPEIIVFSGLSEDALDKFLEEYKRSGIEPVGLKAVLTPTNISWSIYELVCELERERGQYEKLF